MQINVSGGTNAGWRRIKPKTEPWKCPNCEHETRYAVCVRCNTPKP